MALPLPPVRLRALAWACSLPLLATAPGCYEAPELTGTDQVADANVEATALKDNGLAAKEWPEVDDWVRGHMVPTDDEPGCAIAVTRNDALIYVKGYGRARIGGDKWGPATMGPVGSVAKTFTAAAIMRMEELHLLDRDDFVADHLDTTNAALGALSLSELLDHSAGVAGDDKDIADVPHFTAGSDAQRCASGDDEGLDCDDVARTLAEPRLAFEQYQADEDVATLSEIDGDLEHGVYSNVGFSVLGAVVDQVASESSSGYEAWIWDHIGQHTGTPRSFDNLLSLALVHSWRANDIPHRARGYDVTSTGAFQELEAFDLDEVGLVEGWEGPSGGWVMTIGDLARFVVEMHTGSAVSPETLAAMREPRTMLDEPDEPYGYGIFVGNDYQEPTDWHGGIIGGHTSVWAYWDDLGEAHDRVSVSLICNRTDLPPVSLRDHAFSIAYRSRYTLPHVPPPSQLAPVPPAQLDGRTWGLSFARAWQAAPTRALVPITGLRNDLAISARRVGSYVTLSLVERKRGTTTPASGRPTQLLGEVSTSTAAFTTTPANASVASELGTIPIQRLVVSGAFAGGGASLARVSLRGVLDARTVAPAIGTTPSALCAEYAAAGDPCQACTDNARWCLPVRWDGLTGAVGASTR